VRLGDNANQKAGINQTNCTILPPVALFFLEFAPRFFASFKKASDLAPPSPEINKKPGSYLYSVLVKCGLYVLKTLFFSSCSSIDISKNIYLNIPFFALNNYRFFE
jgi:hypothetical protein